ncbi:MAG: ABC transporter ATP-binding protein/permease [Nannocystaceae bacterium]|nr:ABC transporter ATP-binding protein/permease [Nannocystaceae bacterium]
MSTPPKNDKKTDPSATTTVALLRRFWSFAAVHKRWLAIGLSMIPVVAAMSTLRPLLVKHAVDELIPNGDIISLRVLSLGFMIAVMAEFLCQAVQVYSLQRAGHMTISDARRKVFDHVIHLPNRFFDKNALGSLLTRTTSDVEALSETLSFGVFMILTDIVMILSILSAMMWLSPWLTLITLVVAPILFALVRYVGAALRKLQLEVRKAQASQTGFLAEQLSGITVVQLFGREKAAHDEYQRLGGRYLKATKTANVFDAMLYAVMDGISAFSVALLIYFASPSVLTQGGALTLGLLFAFVDYLQRIFIPVKEFSGKLATIQRAAASLERIYGLLDEPTEPRVDPAEANPLDTWKGGVKVRDLEFAYGEDGPDVLKGLSFDVKPGEVVAVVGRTGSGKSSLGRVLTQFYTGYRGSVSMQTPGGDVELRSVKPGHVRKHLLMVQQDVFLFQDSVAYNISLGDSDISCDPDRMMDALELVQARKLIDERGGLDFAVGERGGNLSQGETQLLAFARVAAREPTLLILDEATASVDSITEQKVQEAIEKLLHGRSVIVIAHRLSTVRRADKIIVLSAGKIAEMGSHDELMAKGGQYAELYTMGFEDEEPEA